MEYFGLGTGEILGLSAALSWGVGAFVYGLINKKFSSFLINLLTAVPALIFQLLIIFFFGDFNNLYITDSKLLVIIISTTIITFVVAVTFYIESIKLSGVSIAVPVAATMPLYTLLLAVIFLGESITPFLIIGTVAVVIGISLLSIQKNENKSIRKDVKKGIIYATISAIGWSTSGVLLTVLLIEIDALYINTLRTGLQILFLAAIILVVQKDAFRSILQIKTSDIANVSVGGVLNKSVGVIFFLSSIQLIGVARATAIISIYPLFSFILAIVFLKEKFTYFKLLGTMSIVLGVILVTVYV